MSRPNPRHPRPWHGGALFGEGRRVPLDREARARFRFLLRAHARAGRLPAKGEWIGAALLKRLGADGRCDPSHATLAADAGCSDRTARRATCRLRDLGLLRWEQRLVRAGWRAEQTSNAYQLQMLPAATHALAVGARSSGGQAGRETPRIGIPLCTASAAEVAAAHRALADRRRVIEQRLLGRGVRALAGG